MIQDQFIKQFKLIFTPSVIIYKIIILSLLSSSSNSYQINLAKCLCSDFSSKAIGLVNAPTLSFCLCYVY